MGITQASLVELYAKQAMSVASISKEFRCSQNTVNYWLRKYNIPKRSISEALYIKHNPLGDPFKIQKPANMEEAILYGIGLGLYWGEGTKSNKSSVRLGNTNPALIKKFIEFLSTIYCIDRKKLKFGLQIFSDMDPQEALRFWLKHLRANPLQFQKVIVTPSRGLGNYKNKVKHGVLTVYFNNRKLRDEINGAIENL